MEDILELHGTCISIQSTATGATTVITGIFLHPSTNSTLGFSASVFSGNPGVFCIHSQIKDFGRGDQVDVDGNKYEVSDRPIIGAWRGLTGLKLAELKS